MSGRHRKHWSAAEDEFLREHHLTLMAPEIGRRLGRTARGVRFRAGVLGLELPGPGFGPAFEASLGSAHAEGLSDVEAAGRLGCCVWAVRKWRKSSSPSA